MSLFKADVGRTLRKQFIEVAETFVGYTTGSNGQDIFTQAIGRTGLTWNGAFVDHCAAKTGLLLPSHLLTASALGYYTKHLRVYKRPAIGDIAFFELTINGQPRVGIVTDVSGWVKYGMFQCIEAQVSSGLPKGLEANNGVYKRNRYKYDVIGFARPNFSRARNREEIPEDPGKLQTKPVVKSTIWRINLKHPQVTVIQYALGSFNELTGVPSGTWEHKSRAAYANFQRSIGYLESEADGVPDRRSLEALAEMTQLFTVTD
jgi:hypothetical protein